MRLLNCTVSSLALRHVPGLVHAEQQGELLARHQHVHHVGERRHHLAVVPVDLGVDHLVTERHVDRARQGFGVAASLSAIVFSCVMAGRCPSGFATMPAAPVRDRRCRYRTAATPWSGDARLVRRIGRRPASPVTGSTKVMIAGGRAVEPLAPPREGRRQLRDLRLAGSISAKPVSSAGEVGQHDRVRHRQQSRRIRCPDRRPAPTVRRHDRRGVGDHGAAHRSEPRSRGAVARTAADLGEAIRRHRRRTDEAVTGYGPPTRFAWSSPVTEVAAPRRSPAQRQA